MTETQATYTINQAPPTEPTGYRAIGAAVFAMYGEDVSVRINESFGTSHAYRGLTYAQACELAEKVAEMLNQRAAI